MKKPFRCVACGKGTVRPIAKARRRERYKTMVLPIPATIPIPTCDRCGEEWYDDEASKAVDEALSNIYRQRLRDRAKRAIATLTKFVTQGKIESLLGLSHGYLSHILSGKRDPSTELVANLTMLAHEPKRRIRELEQSWENEREHAA